MAPGDDFSGARFYDRMAEHFDYFDNMHKHGDFTLSKPSFLLRNNKLVSYIDVSFETVAKFFLTEIVLGPKTDTDDSDLRLFLYAEGYDLENVNIRKSLAPYI